MPARTCPRCGDALPDGAPPGTVTCEDYSHRRARLLGDLLTAEEEVRLKLVRGFCALAEAVREGRDMLRPY
jgi:hypothetical protein